RAIECARTQIVKDHRPAETRRNLSRYAQCVLKWSGRALYRSAETACYWFGADCRDLLPKRCQFLTLLGQRLELLPRLRRPKLDSLRRPLDGRDLPSKFHSCRSIRLRHLN